MTSANSPHFPLLDFFQKWQQLDRQQGHRALDSDSYLALLDALEQGIGLWNRDDLLTLCKAVLFKPHHQHLRTEFERLFDACLKPAESNVEAIPTNKPTAPKPTAPPKQESSETSQQAQQNPDLPQEDQPLSKPDVKTRQALHPRTTRVALRHDAETTGEASSSQSSGPDWTADVQSQSFRLKGQYVPVESRSVQQSMRSLRQPNPKHRQRITDLKATIARVARRGFFDRVVTRQQVQMQLPLVLLFDQRGSMVAFHALCADLADAGLRQQPTIPAYYFWNCPIQHVFSDPYLQEAIPLRDWLARYPTAYVLIISDAGAARGFYSEDRLLQTSQFLDELRPRRVVWLNPMPRQRWWRSTAAAIARRVPMFTIEATEFPNVFKYLKNL